MRRSPREVAGNSLPTDDDRDFRSGEDPPADLNADGWITMMRVADPLGTHRPHPADSRVLIPVDARKNEAGAYRLYVEARDTDGDKLFGEDPGDGVDFNRNFTCNYPYFGRGAGPHQVSEPETRAVADFAFDHPNIAVVFCFSPEDNLFHPWKANPQLESQRIKTTLLSADAPYADYMAERFRELHGGQDAPAPPPSEGSFSQWAYFHYGRWSLAARPWWIPPAPSPPPKPEGSSPPDTAPQGKSAEVEPPPPDVENSSEGVPAHTPQPAAENSAEPSTGPPPGPGEKPLGKDDKRGAEDLAALAWFAAQGIDGFVDWQPFEHPDFPQITVEIGGFKPFHRLNPPVELIDPLVRPHVDFLVQLSDLWPRMELRQVEVHRLTAGLYEVTCRVVNAGYLPTMPEMGSTNRHGYPIQVTWDLPEGTRWLEGSRRTSVSRLEGRGGNRDLRWVFQLPDLPTEPLRGSLRAAAPTMHPVTVDVELAP